MKKTNGMRYGADNHKCHSNCSCKRCDVVSLVSTSSGCNNYELKFNELKKMLQVTITKPGNCVDNVTLDCCPDGGRQCNTACCEKEGPRGPPGPPGEFVSSGEWDPCKCYRYGAVVHVTGDCDNLGGLYIYQGNHSSKPGVSPENDPNWVLLVNDGECGKDGKNGKDGKDGKKGDKGDTGATGAKGDKGDSGILGVYVGIWNPNVSYKPYSIVRVPGDCADVGKVYIYTGKGNSPIGVDPADDPDWKLLLKDGECGKDGIAGIWRGDYDPNVTYRKGDIVRVDGDCDDLGGSYIYTGSTPIKGSNPKTNPDWNLMIHDGECGKDGIAGIYYGEWNAAISYKPYSIVRVSGDCDDVGKVYIYVGRVNSTPGVNPADSPDWKLLIQDGECGKNGEPGLVGNYVGEYDSNVTYVKGNVVYVPGSCDNLGGSYIYLGNKPIKGQDPRNGNGWYLLVQNGECGEAGLVGIFKGEYNPALTYVTGDVVHVEGTCDNLGGAYIYEGVLPSKGMDPRDGNGWSLLVQDGQCGQSGIVGDFKGEYNPSYPYQKYDIVRVNGDCANLGATYIYLGEGTSYNQYPPDGNGWSLLNKDGKCGEDGILGIYYGEWDATMSYDQYSIVRVNGDCADVGKVYIYMSSVPSKPGISPADDPNWALLLKDGECGKDGVVGVYRGEYDNDTIYYPNDVVRVDGDCDDLGGLYIYQGSGTSIGNNPKTDPDWTLMLLDGQCGEDGKGLNWRGIFNPGRVYYKNDIVRVNKPCEPGKVYIYFLDEPSGPYPSETDITTIPGWELMVMDGVCDDHRCNSSCNSCIQPKPCQEERSSRVRSVIEQSKRMMEGAAVADLRMGQMVKNPKTDFSLIFKHQWSKDKVYYTGDVVIYQNIIYVALNNNNEIPSDSTKWEQLSGVSTPMLSAKPSVNSIFYATRIKEVNKYVNQKSDELTTIIPFENILESDNNYQSNKTGTHIRIKDQGLYRVTLHITYTNAGRVKIEAFTSNSFDYKDGLLINQASASGVGSRRVENLIHYTFPVRVNAGTVLSFKALIDLNKDYSVQNAKSDDTIILGNEKTWIMIERIN